MHGTYISKWVRKKVPRTSEAALRRATHGFFSTSWALHYVCMPFMEAYRDYQKEREAAADGVGFHAPGMFLPIEHAKHALLYLLPGLAYNETMLVRLTCAMGGRDKEGHLSLREFVEGVAVMQPTRTERAACTHAGASLWSFGKDGDLEARGIRGSEEFGLEGIGHVAPLPERERAQQARRLTLAFRAFDWRADGVVDDMEYKHTLNAIYDAYRGVPHKFKTIEQVEQEAKARKALNGGGKAPAPPVAPMKFPQFVETISHREELLE